MLGVKYMFPFALSIQLTSVSRSKLPASPSDVNSHTVWSLSGPRCHVQTSASESQWGSIQGANCVLPLSSSCHPAVSLSCPDRQRGEDDSPGMRAQDQVETIDSTPGSNYELHPGVCSNERTACLSPSETQLRPHDKI